MTYNSPQPLKRLSGLWRFDDTLTEKTDEGPVALLRAMYLLGLQHKTKLILCTAIGMGLATLYAKTLPQTYSATATLLLEPRRQAAISGQEAIVPGSLDLNRADSELQIIRSERLLSAVFDSLDLENAPSLGPASGRMIDAPMAEVQRYLDQAVIGKRPAAENNPAVPEIGKSARSVPPAAPSDDQAENSVRQAAFQDFIRNLNVRRVGQSYVIEIEYSATDPVLAARVANAMLSGYISQSVGFKAQLAQAGTEALQGRLDALAAQVNAATDAMRHGTLPIIPTPDADARIIGAALPPVSPSGPRSKLIMALGGVLGLIGGFTILALDRKVRTAKDLMRDTGVPCLGTIPEAGSWIGAAWRTDIERAALVVSQPSSRYAVAMRDLRTSIEIACSSIRSERSLVIAIAGWEEGANISTVCLSLAQLINRSGRYVTLFKSEVGRPDYEAGGMDSSVAVSLADALIADVRPEQVLFTNRDGITVLPIHSVNPETNLFADFRDRRVARIVESARVRGDVLIDLPPLHDSTDALALAIHADAVLIVATAGKTTTDEVNDMLHQLRRSGANVIGTVVNRRKA